ncbi:MAG: hypothetical protein ACOYOK_03695 [Pseudobdellovibrionaceae bacterium]
MRRQNKSYFYKITTLLGLMAFCPSLAQSQQKKTCHFNGSQAGFIEISTDGKKLWHRHDPIDISKSKASVEKVNSIIAMSTSQYTMTWKKNQRGQIETITSQLDKTFTGYKVAIPKLKPIETLRIEYAKDACKITRVEINNSPRANIGAPPVTIKSLNHPTQDSNSSAAK